MKRIEVASDGTKVITKLIHMVQDDCYLLVQEIETVQGVLELRSTITLSRDDIDEMAEQVAEKQAPKPTADDDVSYCGWCDKAIREADEKHYRDERIPGMNSQVLYCSQKCIDGYHDAH